jgi:hypothetical protein
MGEGGLLARERIRHGGGRASSVEGVNLVLVVISSGVRLGIEEVRPA